MKATDFFLPLENRQKEEQDTKPEIFWQGLVSVLRFLPKRHHTILQPSILYHESHPTSYAF
jgi:hypothetical protein